MILPTDADSIPHMFVEREFPADETQEAHEQAECDKITRENKATNRDHDNAKDPKEEHDHDHNNIGHETIGPKEQRTDAVAVHAGTRRTKSRAVAQDPKEIGAINTIEEQAQAEHDMMSQHELEHHLRGGEDREHRDHAAPRAPSLAGKPCPSDATARSISEDAPMLPQGTREAPFPSPTEPCRPRMTFTGPGTSPSGVLGPIAGHGDQEQARLAKPGVTMSRWHDTARGGREAPTGASDKGSMEGQLQGQMNLN